MKTYNVGVFFEEGAVLRVDADSIEEATPSVKTKKKIAKKKAAKVVKE